VSVIRFEWDEEKNLSNQRKHGVKRKIGTAPESRAIA
jgi:uncharacterized DUF497 family protein